MKVTLLVVQRRNSYPGEFAPEVAGAIDEFTDNDNPEYWVEEVDAVRKSNDYESYAQIAFNVPDDVVNRALEPVVKTTPHSFKIVTNTQGEQA